MGANMSRRLMAAGHEIVAWDVSLEAVQALARDGAAAASTPQDMVSQLKAGGGRAVVWLMVPAAFVDDTIARFEAELGEGDVLIDGGNSCWQDDIVRGTRLEAAGIRYLDVGVSGGVWGKDRGYCQMIGGQSDAVKLVSPIFAALAPGVEAAERTPGATGEPSTAEQGWLHCGDQHGAGHFVKMVHNGIEYGLMAAYAEGLNILQHAGAGRVDREDDAETSPLRNPEHYQYDFDLAGVTEVWRRGSVIASWLLDLTATSLHDDPQLKAFAGRVSDSGEGRWMLEAGIDVSAPSPVLAAALFQRFSSRGEAAFADKVLSAMRFQFGGHHEKEAGS
jgi:6-phosphogluconate dehydrogenase